MYKKKKLHLIFPTNFEKYAFIRLRFSVKFLNKLPWYSDGWHNKWKACDWWHVCIINLKKADDNYGNR